MNEIILANVIVLSLIAIIAAIVLYFSAQKFKTESSPLAEEIAAMLPQANCGACGRAGCQDFANACIHADKETFSHLYCPVGGTKVMNNIAQRLGYTISEHEATTAVLLCNGNCKNAPDKVEYYGLNNCRLAHHAFVGKTGCPNGCLKFGDCVKACPFGALSINPETGLPQVDKSKCTSCGHCVKICPRGLFEIRSQGKNGVQVYVACKNTQKGVLARKNCSVACIGCMKCAKICPEIQIKDNLSYIPNSVDAEKFGADLAQNCPTGAIIYTGVNHEQN